MKKKKYQENRKPKKEYEKINIRKILDKKENMKKNKYADNLQRQRKYKKKNKYEENPEPKREYEKIYTRKTLNQIENMRKKTLRKILN